MRTAASPARSLLSTVHVCECVSFPQLSCGTTVYYISGRKRFSGVVTLWSKSVCFILDTLYWQSCGKQLCSNLRSAVRLLTLPLSSLLFVLLLFHSSHPSPLASQCDSIYPSWRGSVACLGAGVMKLKTSSLVYRTCQVLYVTRLRTCTETLRVLI